MGLTIPGMSMEEMCAAMCDNVIPEEKPGWYYFTFGAGQQHAGQYVKIYGTYDSARTKMFNKYGAEWAFQYSEAKWDDWLRKKPAYIRAEEYLETIE